MTAIDARRAKAKADAVAAAVASQKTQIDAARAAIKQMKDPCWRPTNGLCGWTVPQVKST
jgi:hypothetical protein